MRALVITNSITRRDAKSLEKYMTEVSRYEVLTPEQEVDLFRRYREGDEDAFQLIINSNLRFVISVAKQYQHCGLTLGDLINEGNLGLLKAARRFDETRGFKFISYAVWWIRQSILQAIGEKSRKIRVPFNHQSDLIKVLRTRDMLLQIYEREPTNEEIAAELEMTVEAVEKCLETNNKCSSLDEPLQEGEDATLSNFLEDKDTPTPDSKVVDVESLQKEIQMLLKGLSPKESTVISMYYGIGTERTFGLSEISDHLGVGKERVRQIKYKGLRKLQAKLARHNINFSLN
ncbi:MAG: sigma-70 family RNA polymerase sigma factor [Saprospiraceae bacterium]|jgi:RNA polymerase primary sigma factor|nr:RNA polymerase subunit sigma [Saprospirales bacterium]RME09769.1 MAG: RNA polymerase sigma factor RpoD/SigA [Bacteroidota bacterium]